MADPWRCIPLPVEGHPTALASALLHCPGAHAFWSWWLISTVHLRPVEGFPPAELYVEGATHEILVVAIDPERCPTPDPAACMQGYPHLTPADQIVQATLRSDGAAIDLHRWLCEEVAAGRLSPDSDYRRLWQDSIAHWVKTTSPEVSCG